MLCTSEHVRKLLIDNGLNVPAFVVGNGCDHWLNTSAETTKNVDDGTFRFLHVSSCFPRKGVQAMLQAWGRAFTRRDNVILIIKTFNNPHNEIDAWLAHAQAQFAEYPKVEVIKEDMSASQLKGLYESCDVLVARVAPKALAYLSLKQCLVGYRPSSPTGAGNLILLIHKIHGWLIIILLG